MFYSSHAWSYVVIGLAKFSSKELVAVRTCLALQNKFGILVRISYICIMKYNIEKLKEMVNDKQSFIKIGKEFGYSDVYVRKLCIKLGLIIPRSIKRKGRIIEKKSKGICKNCGKQIYIWGKKYCDENCYHEDYTKSKYKDFLENNEKFCRSDYSCRIFKKHFLEEQNHECAICKMKDEWNNKPLIFVLDHIDGNAANNKRANLRLICHNCDSQLDTYKSKNKNSARKERYLLNYKN